jgi:hypothetical protein
MWSGLSAAAKEGLEDGLSGLERLKKNLQSAAVMCQPAGAAGAVVFETELEARCGHLLLGGVPLLRVNAHPHFWIACALLYCSQHGAAWFLLLRC